MDRQHMGFGEKMKANRFASTVVILATLSLGILIGTVVSAWREGQGEGGFVVGRDSTPGSLAAATVEPVLADRAPA